MKLELLSFATAFASRVLPVPGGPISMQPFGILAPTGRAARVVGARTNNVAHTIHSIIYSLSHIEVFEEAESANDPGIRYFFPVKTEDPGETLFIVDEASMVGDKPSKQDVLRFGSGSLLTDLIESVLLLDLIMFQL